MGATMQQQQTVDTFAARASSADIGQGIYNTLTKQALKYGQDVNAALAGGMSFLSTTRDANQLEKLNNLAMRLAKLNPAEGLQGAAFSMKELLSGDYTSIVDRFNMGRGMIQNSAALQAAKAGDLEGFIKGMDQLLNQQNMTQEAFEKMLESPAAKWEATINRFKYNLAEAGAAGMRSFAPLIQMLNNFMQSGAFNAVMAGLSGGIDLAVRSVTWLVNGVQWLGQSIMNLQYALPIIAALASGFLAYYSAVNAVTLATKIAKAAQMAYNAVLNANPIGLVIAAIGALIIGLLTLIATVEPVREGFAKAFEFMGDVVSRFVKWALNGLESFINGFVNAVNTLLDGVNKVINAVGKFMGLESEINLQLKTVDFSQFSDKVASGIQSTFDKAASFTRNFNEDNLRKMANQMLGFGGTKGFTSSLGDLNGGAALAAGQIDSIGRIGEVGKIRDTVDISSEDIKMMRELAEMKAIQNNVSLTPTVQINGDMHVRKESDIDTIISRITEKLEENIASSAQGIYL